MAEIEPLRLLAEERAQGIVSPDVHTHDLSEIFESRIVI
jgi:hypothetical protein